MIDHDIMRFDIAMHNPHAVTVIKGSQQLVEIPSNVVVGQGLVELLEIGVVYVLKYEGWGSRHRVLDHAVQRDHVRAAT